eukprot:scaffold84748_cov31-Tisochrysis_lutea.AAC.1
MDADAMYMYMYAPAQGFGLHACPGITVPGELRRAPHNATSGVWCSRECENVFGSVLKWSRKCVHLSH